MVVVVVLGGERRGGGVGGGVGGGGVIDSMQKTPKRQLIWSVGGEGLHPIHSSPG